MRAEHESPGRELSTLFLRRVAIALEEYDLAKARTDEFQERRRGGEQPIGLYLSAMHHWEQCIAASWQAIDAAIDLTGKKAFEKNADSPSVAERLNHLYNWSKHSDQKIGATGLTQESTSLAVWPSNEGLRSVQHVLTWSELAAALDDLVKGANLLLDPKAR